MLLLQAFDIRSRVSIDPCVALSDLHNFEIMLLILLVCSVYMYFADL